MLKGFEQQFEQLPLVAILRGVKPMQVIDIAQALVDKSIRLIEVPMNSPDAFDSIARLVEHFGEDIICGGGTVVNIQQVEKIHALGGRLIVSPNCDPVVIKRALALDMISMPGVATPTEAFTAIDAGATYLKLFPAAGLGEQFIKNLKSVLPQAIKLIAVGGIGQANIQAYWQSGVQGFGIGGDLFQANDTSETVATKAAALITKIRSLEN